MYKVVAIENNTEKVLLLTSDEKASKRYVRLYFEGLPAKHRKSVVCRVYENDKLIYEVKND